MDLHSPIQFAAYTPSPSPPPSSAGSGLVQRRQRVTIACAYCRRRKIKCDGNDRCSNCDRLKQPCVYTKCAISGSAGSPAGAAGILAISPSATTAKKDSKRHKKHHSFGANDGPMSSESSPDWNDYAQTFQAQSAVDPTSLYAKASNALAGIATTPSSSSFHLIDINASSLSQRRKKAGASKTAPTSIPTSSDEALLIQQMAQLRSQSASPHMSGGHFAYLPPTPESYQYSPESITDTSAYYYSYSKPSSDLLYQPEYHSAPPNVTEFNLEQSCKSSPSSDEQSEDHENYTSEPSMMPPSADMHDMLLFSGAPAPYKETDASWLNYLHQTQQHAQSQLYPSY